MIAPATLFAALFTALEAAWPPAATTALGPFTYRTGAGGGKRVSAATATAPHSPSDLTKIEARFAADARPPIFMIRDGSPTDAALDSDLAARGYRILDPVTLRIAPIDAFSPTDPDRTYPVWPPLAVQREIWRHDGIGPDRIAIMTRAQTPKTTLLARIGQAPAGTAYVALADGIASVHALVTDPALRGRGVARAMMNCAADWARERGAKSLCVQVTDANDPANALYSSLGMTPCAHYHYRVK
ncbi:GNAT family N-acetyltransferase [Celeribacter arenosi]|uniref:GNAT family N-acetyltransferase n=1 Tax=Celeribacter arenosi TaxID=792649 RepID=A0ABP7K099_9RHOB